jgi:hypothetical protein
MQHLQAILRPKGRPAGKIKGTGMLSKGSNGTGSANTTDSVGVMPDFAKIQLVRR